MTDTFGAEARAVLTEAARAIGWDPAVGDPGDIEVQRSFYRALHALGWSGLAWPTEFGGAGRTLEEQARFAEEAARLDVPESYNRVALGIAGPAIMLFGTDEQRARFLPPILAGDEVWCQGFSEPDAGSDLAGLRTRATLDDGRWTITGQKIWTTLGRIADYCFLLVRTSEERHGGITALLVPMDQPGITVRPIRQINGEEDFCEVFFDSATTPADAILGAPGDGWRVAMGALGYERSVHLVQRQVRLDRMVEVVTTSVRQSPLREELADAALDLQQSALTMRHAVRRQLQAIDGGTEPGIEANATKVRWSETYQAAARLAVDLAAATPGTPGLGAALAQYYTSLATSIYAGTNEIQRNIVAERGLGLPR